MEIDYYEIAFLWFLCHIVYRFLDYSLFLKIDLTHFCAMSSFKVQYLRAYNILIIYASYKIFK